ncbi:YicC/YloC family endoribonuclease [Alkaliphilus crotonatoxidans]
MLKSMTGFGRGESQTKDIKFLVELKSLNHRYMDVSIKMPKLFTYLEERIRQTVKEQIKRGRVEVFIGYENIGEADVEVTADLPLAKRYLQALSQIEEQLAVKNDITVSLIAKFPDVIRVEKQELDEDVISQCLLKGVENALEKLVEMRRIEGEGLKADILKRLNLIGSMLKDIAERSPHVVTEYRQRLTERIREILDDGYSLDDNRIMMEVALFADKSNITEELVRFESHIRQFKGALEESDSVGRKLDFLIQEMNREINTIGSKANDLYITNIVINVKSELEKMREQVQNIE